MQRPVRPEIDRALRYIADHLDRPITAADVARAAHLSEFHLQRVFHDVVGEPIGRFVTRRRLELAALRLAYEPDRSIGDIAFASGYSSASNFSKAFSAYFGCSPTRVREPRDLPTSIGKLAAEHGKHFRPEDLYTLPPEPSSHERRRIAAEWSARVRFEELERPRPLACLASEGGYDFASLDRTWRDLVARAQQLGLARDGVDAWGIAHDSPRITAPELCRYQACVPCPADVALAPPLFRGAMPAGRYAVFRYEGAVEGVEPAYRSIYSCWLRESSLAPEDFTPFDHYVADHPRDGRVELEMWLRVKPRE